MAPPYGAVLGSESGSQTATTYIRSSTGMKAWVSSGELDERAGWPSMVTGMVRSSSPVHGVVFSGQ